MPIPRSLFHPRWWLNGPLISKTFAPWKSHYHDSAPTLPTSQRLNDITATGLQVLTARDGLTGLARARFDNQLVKTDKALLEFAGQVAQDDLLPTRLPDKVNKPKWAKPRKPHGKASARSYTSAEAAELAADQAEQSSRAAGRQVARPDTSENSTEEGIIIPGTPPRAGESQGGTTITLPIRTPERLRGPPDLVLERYLRPKLRPKLRFNYRHQLPPEGLKLGDGKRRRIANKFYTNSQYEL